MKVGSVDNDHDSDDVSDIAEFEGNEVNKVGFVEFSSMACDGTNSLLEIYNTEEVMYSLTTKQVCTTDSK